MSYSVTPILHTHKDKNSLHNIIIRVIYKRSKVYIKTEFRIKADQFKSGEVVNHSNQVKINSLIRKKIIDVESKLLDAMRDGLDSDTLKQLFKEVVGKKKDVKLYDFILNLCDRNKGKMSEGTLKHYRSLASKLDKWFPDTHFADVNIQWLESFEAKLREPVKIKKTEIILDNNTISANMKRLKSVLNKADGLIRDEQYIKYKVPLYRQKLVEYLTEKELEGLTSLLKKINKQGHKIAGYYFLLACYTGWRISDVKTFDYNKMVTGGRIPIRAKKNRQIVSIPIHTRLKNVLSFIKDVPFDLSEQKAREYVKDLCSLAGINKNVSFHTGRHSFAMLLMANGFTIDEAAELLGDSSMIAKVYARIHNESLDKKIRERLG